MERVNLTPEELEMIKKLRAKKTSDSDEKRKRDAKNRKDNLTMHSRYNQLRRKNLRAEMIAKIYNTVETRDSRKIFFMTTEERWFCPYNRTHEEVEKGEWSEHKKESIDLVKEFFPDFKPLEPKKYLIHRILFDYSDYPEAYLYMRKHNNWHLKNNGTVEEVRFWEVESQGWHSKLTGLKMEGERPFTDSYQKYSVKGYVEAVYRQLDDWTENAKFRRERKKIMKNEVKALNAYPQVKKVRYNSADECFFRVFVEFKNGSSMSIDPQCVMKTETRLGDRYWCDTEPPKRPKTYAEIRSYLINQNS